MRASLSHVEYNRRVQMLSNSNFTSLVVQKAKEAMKDAATEDDSEDSLYHDNGFFKQSTFSQDPAEEDLDEQVSTDEPKEMRIDEDEDDTTEASIIPYEVSARTFMEVILNGNTSTKRDWKNNPAPCHLCQEDDTIDDEELKTKLYTKEEHLKNHMGTFLHTPLGRWSRLAEARATGEGDERQVHCPYCAELGVDRGFFHFRHLKRHVELDSGLKSPDLIEKHRALKDRDGWNDPGFAKCQDEHQKKKLAASRQYEHRTKVRIFGQSYSEAKDLAVPVPHYRTGLVHGSPPGTRDLRGSPVDIAELWMPAQPLHRRHEKSLHRVSPLISTIGETIISEDFSEELQVHRLP